MDESSSFELNVTTFFDAAHRLLAEEYGSGTRLHGHTYHVAISMRGNELRADHMIFNHYQVRGVIKRVIDELHDRYLNDIPALGGVNTTPEVIASYIWSQLENDLSAEGVGTLSVEVAESPTTKVRYEAPVRSAI